MITPRLDQARSVLVAPAIAATVALVAITTGWTGVDLAEHIYSVGMFRREGLTLWDGQWFGGHWTFGYTVLYSPVAATLGLPVTAVASAVVAAWAFERLVGTRFGARARVGSIVFALGTLGQVAVAQLPFLLGEALALCALLAASRRRWLVAVACGVATALSSPLAGAFLALALAAWIVSSWPRDHRRLVAVLASVAVPVALLELAFPQGAMPYPPANFAIDVAVFAGLVLLVPREHRALRLGSGLYVLAIVASFVLPTAMGGNIVRLGGCVALPLVLIVLDGRRRQAAVLLLVPIVAITWAPVWSSATAGRNDPSTQAAYYAPLVRYLHSHDQPLGLVEIVPTRLHWETVFVAPTVPIARGSERQLDSTDNPIFYGPNQLTASTYRQWLLNTGVRYVAASDAPLDFAGVGEAQLLARQENGLRLVWRDAHWRLFEVVGSTGIVSGPGRLVRIERDKIVLRATGAGELVVRARPAHRWTLTTGHGCVRTGPDATTMIKTPGPQDLVLRVGLLPASQPDADDAYC